ncbi:N-terminal cleavage protein [Opitutaceae bacterium TAV5]|nr:N-terminal cleavage protein [Opitutaceae bacterium TAV5]
MDKKHHSTRIHFIRTELSGVYPGISRFGRKASGAFTLIELLAVIAIIGILAAIIISGLGMVRSKAAKAVCLGNLRQFGVALALYEADHKQLPNGSGKLWDAGGYTLRDFPAYDYLGDEELVWTRPDSVYSYLSTYLDNRNVGVCPALKTTGESSYFGAVRAKACYIWYMGASVYGRRTTLADPLDPDAVASGLADASQEQNPSRVWLMAERTNPDVPNGDAEGIGPHGNHQGNMLFADGHVATGMPVFRPTSQKSPYR